MIGGDTFRLPRHLEPHLWMIISDPDKDAARVLMVNFTSWHGGDDRCDDSCVANQGEHPFLKHKSYVIYSESRVCSLQELHLMERNGLLVRQESLSPALLQRVRESSRRSLKRSHLNILIQQGLIAP